MKKYVILFSICATVVMITASLASVVGYHNAQTAPQQPSSPLFTVRTHQATQQTTRAGTVQFLGKGARTSLFPASSSQDELLRTALQFFTKHPAVFTMLVSRLVTFPYIAAQLAAHGITTQDLTMYVRMLQAHPASVQEALADIQQQQANDKNDPQPRGLSTSNPLGCFIVAAFALLPVTITLTLLLLFFTLRILTCMNFNDCANTIAQQIWSQLIQGLTQN